MSFDAQAPAPTPNYYLIAHGDSLTAGSGGATPYETLVATTLTSGARVASAVNRGIGGQSWDYSNDPGVTPTLIVDAPNTVDPERTQLGGSPVKLLIWAGTNGIWLGGHSAATEYTNFQTYYAARKTAGWADANITVITMLPRDTVPANEASRQTYNTSLRNFCIANGCNCADAGGDATIGAPGSQTNTTYYQVDQVHLTTAGQQIVANLVLAFLP